MSDSRPEVWPVSSRPEATAYSRSHAHRQSRPLRYRLQWFLIAVGFSGPVLFGSEPVPPEKAPSIEREGLVASSQKPEWLAAITRLRDENQELMQALEVTLTNQEKLTNQLRKTNEALAAVRNDVELVRERLHDLELAYESRPVSVPVRKTGVAQRH